MQIIYKAVEDLIPYEKNPRKNDDAVEYVANSIKEFGFKVPIVIDANNVIVAGHTRLKASKLLGLDEVPCVVADDLTEEQIKAYRLADNKTSEFAGWDVNLLAEEISGIIDINMEDFGFEELGIEEEEPEVKPEIKFTEVLGEESNYLVLKFNTEIDWLNALTIFEPEQARCYSTRKDGKVTKGMERIGLGRVLDGVTVINKIRGEE